MHNLSRQEKMFLSSCFEKISRGEATAFLNPKECSLLEKRCEKERISYQIWKPYDEAEKSILYHNQCPVVCYLLQANTLLSHRMILGTLFSHQIKNESFGDIVIIEDSAYIFVLSSVAPYVKDYFHSVGKVPVKVTKQPLECIKTYKPKFQYKMYMIASLRFDVVVAAITKNSRSKTQTLFRNGDILYDYREMIKGNFCIEVGKVFSVRHFGKYRIDEIGTMTKSGKIKLVIARYV